MVGERNLLRVYVDTSVIGGCLEDEFAPGSLRLFERSRAGAVRLVISETTLAELAGAPLEVRMIVKETPQETIEYVYLDGQTEDLADAYVAFGAVPRRMRVDAQHIALATIANVDVLVSWNYKHIVNLDRIRAFNAVNLQRGYAALEIRSPMELWKDDDEDV